MEYPRDWVITTLGKVVRRDKAKKDDVIDETYNFNGVAYKNSFSEKDEALSVRDNIITNCPTAFLPPIPELEQEDTSMPRKKVLNQDDFREQIRDAVTKRLDIFWANWALLPPKDKCDLFYKMFAYGFSKAPVEKAQDDADQRRADRKRAEAAERISQGLNTPADTDFEE